MIIAGRDRIGGLAVFEIDARRPSSARGRATCRSLFGHGTLSLRLWLALRLDLRPHVELLVVFADSAHPLADGAIVGHHLD